MTESQSYAPGGLHAADLHALQSHASDGASAAAAASAPAAAVSAAPAFVGASGAADSQMQPSLSSSAVHTQRTDEKSAMEDGGALFSCKADSTARLVDLLETLMLDKDQKASVHVLPAGLKFSVDKGKSMSAKAYIKQQTFGSFEIRAKEVDFNIPLHTLIQCLSVFGGTPVREPPARDSKKGGAGHWTHDQMRAPPSNAQLALEYPAVGHPLSLSLEEDGVVTQCTLNTFDDSATTSRNELNFRSTPIIARAVVKSTFLRDAFLELDAPSATTVTIRMSPQHPQFTMTVDGNLGQCKVEFPPSTASEIFTEFECKATIVNTYPLALLRACKAALNRSDTTNMRFNEGGMLSLQHVISSTTGMQNWVEYLIVPQEAGAAMDDDEKVKAEKRK